MIRRYLNHYLFLIYMPSSNLLFFFNKTNKKKHPKIQRFLVGGSQCTICVAYKVCYFAYGCLELSKSVKGLQFISERDRTLHSQVFKYTRDYGPAFLTIKLPYINKGGVKHFADYLLSLFKVSLISFCSEMLLIAS